MAGHAIFAFHLGTLRMRAAVATGEYRVRAKQPTSEETIVFEGAEIECEL